ncbi:MULTISPECIES: hypothetical protein [Pseudomonas]|uniref:Uncharacterized protein n=1 Tax=Pseudomonas fluorescens ICMP 11288 TaxID=1198309 RepID=A0A0W0I1J6_PSEFL|nr:MULTISPECIES: hypothetical protein [Pseudomonas]KTB67030.1 hypothetical protein AO063_21255 [Pseudomonas fluorescens ICMP 11288]
MSEMKVNDDSTSYKIWPFQSAEVSVNGDRNNGGINLVGSPELIELIHEATEENGLRQLLLSMNAPGRAFMTLGCLTGEADSAYFSYVEFTPRDQNLARNEHLITGIHRLWLEWSNENCTAYPGLVDALHQNVKWEYRTFSFRGSDPQYLITIYLRARSARDHASLISWVHNFLCSVDANNLQRTL